MLYQLSGRNIPSNANTIYNYCRCDCIVLIFRPNIPSNTNTVHIYFPLSLSGRNIPSNTNTIHIYCCCVCVVFTLRPEYSVQYKYNTHSVYTLTFRPEYFRPIQIQYTLIVVLFVYSQFSGRNIPSNTNTIHIYCCCVCVVFTFRPEYSVQYKYNTHLLFHSYFPAGIFRPIQIQYTFSFPLSLSGRNIPSNTNTIHIDCCFVCVVSTFRPEYSVQYKCNTYLLLLCLCCIHFPAGIFRPIQIQYTFSVHSHFPAGLFRPIQIQYTLIVVLFVLYQLSGRNIPSNTNTITHLLFTLTFRPEYFVQYKYNTHWLLLCLCCINFPAGIFRPIQIQYTIIVVVIALYLIFRPEYSVQYKYNIHVLSIITFRPEYSVQYKYNTQLIVIVIALCCINFPAGIFRQIQIQYTFIVVLY